MVDIEKFLDNEKTDEERVIKELLDTKNNMESKTDLNDANIIEVLKLSHIAKKYKLKEIDDLIKLFMKLRISRNRLGRREFIDAIRANRENRENVGMFGNLRDKIR